MIKQRRDCAIATAIMGLAFTPPSLGSAAPAAEATARTANVPYVGCASDGQLGPQPPPKRSKPTPRLPAPVASRLAYYAAVNNGVLAPRGWHCFSLYGSSGTTVLVAPDPFDVKHVFDRKFKLSGDAVEFGYLLGGTSGRFEVAQVASTFFPVARDFVNAVAKEEKEIGLPFDLSGKDFRKDRIVNRTNKTARLVTPAGQQGWGTRDRLAANETPIEGLAVLITDEPAYPDLIELNLRLPQKDRDLVAVIQSVAEANRGNPLSDTPLRGLPEEGTAGHRRPR